MNIGNLRLNRLLTVAVMTLALGTTSAIWAAKGGGGAPAPAPTTTQVYDTSFAVEYSYSCLSGGCHEGNAKLVDDYSKSLMTHAMVKCNACHGTHTAVDVGKPKPNLTGYFPGIGATGYVVGKDRCLTCHSSTLTVRGHPSNPGECISCHAPHMFAK